MEADPLALPRLVLRFWPRLLVLTAILLVLQENLEQLGHSGPLPGLAVLVGNLGAVDPGVGVAVLIQRTVVIVARLRRGDA